MFIRTNNQIWKLGGKYFRPPPYPWTPLYLTNLILWYDPADEDTIIESGGVISQILDKSGNGYHGTPLSVGREPSTGSASLAGKNLLSVDQDALIASIPAGTFPTSMQTTILFYRTGVSDLGDQQLFARTSGGSPRPTEYYGRFPRWGGDLGNALHFSDYVRDMTTPRIVAFAASALGGYVWKNGDERNEGGTTDRYTDSADDFVIGANDTGARALRGNLGDIVVTPQLCPLNNAKLEGYIAHKYGLTANLDDQHLFKTEAPTTQTCPGAVDLVLTIGQSNMSGSAPATGSPTTDPYCMQHLDGTRVLKADNPTTGGSTDGGPRPAFANKWYELTGRGVMYIEQGKGATALLAAANAGSGYWAVGGTLYSPARDAMNDAIAQLAVSGVTVANKIVIFCQGERDSQAINGTTVTGALYQAELENLIDTFDAQITGGIDAFLISELGAESSFSGEADWAEIRAAQNAAASSRALATMAFTGAKDFPNEGKMYDSLHYNQTGYNEMGEGIAIGGQF